MPNNLTNSTATISTAQRDEIAADYRDRGFAWGRIALLLNMANESSARTAANRHYASVGRIHGHVASASPRQPRQPRAARQYSRTYGIEIEFTNASRYVIARAVETATGQAHVPVVDYHQSRCLCGCGIRITNRMWKVERDGSVSQGDYGGEVVSPILSGQDGLEMTKKVMRNMRAAGADVNQTCGMHVHVSVDHMSNAQRAQLLRTLHTHHDVLDRLVAPSRHTNSYCRPPSQAEVDVWRYNIEHRGAFGPQERYRSINVNSFSKYGTIEIRYHQGTLNGRKAAAWVNFLLGLFDAAANDQTDALAPGLALLGSLADLGRLTHQDVAYLTTRASVLAGR